MGIVLPEGVLGTGSMKRVREFVEARARILLIVSLPIEVFASAGASVKSSIVFLQKFTEEERKQRETYTKEVLKMDIKYLRKAITLKKDKYPNLYSGVDFLSLGGTDKEVTELFMKKNRQYKREKDFATCGP